MQQPLFYYIIKFLKRTSMYDEVRLYLITRNWNCWLFKHSNTFPCVNLNVEIYQPTNNQPLIKPTIIVQQHSYSDPEQFKLQQHQDLIKCLTPDKSGRICECDSLTCSEQSMIIKILLERIINFSSRVCSHIGVQCPHKSAETAVYTQSHVATSLASPAGTNSSSNQHR